MIDSYLKGAQYGFHVKIGPQIAMEVKQRFIESLVYFENESRFRCETCSPTVQYYEYKQIGQWWYTNISPTKNEAM